MPRPVVPVILLALIFLTAGLLSEVSDNAVDTGKIKKMQNSGKLSENINFNIDALVDRQSYEACTRQYYICIPSFYWRIPGMAEYCAMRFSVSAADTSLEGIGIALYGNETVGTPDLDAYVWGDNGSGFPDLSNVIYQTTLPFESLVYYPEFNHIDISAAGIIINSDFHVGWATNRTPDPSGYLAAVIDNGSCGSLRSSIYRMGAWMHMPDATGGNDNNFLIYVDLCNLDIDSDSIPNSSDNCPLVYNPEQTDGDNDNVGDACDNCVADYNPDQANADEDIWGDACDNCPAITNSDQSDGDADGHGDVCDNCPTLYNPDQDDSDGDNFGDVCDSCPLDSENDIDEDGLCADQDNCPQIYNPGQEDIDGDGIGSACDDCIDSDSDGYGNPGYAGNQCPDDNCPNIYNPGQFDYDGDGIGDSCDFCNDIDSDGFGDPGFVSDTCPPDNCPTVANPDQLDSDYDGAGDSCDVCPYDSLDDADDDGYCGDIDNCPDLYNPDQQDTDGDGVGDICEAIDTVYIDLARSGTPDPIDTIYVTFDYEFRIWLKNEVDLGGMSLGFQIWSDNGAAWTWLAMPDGLGPEGPGTGLACITVPNGCRMDPPDSVWDLLDGLLITEKNMDEISPDTIQLGGISLEGALAAGPVEHMISLHFTAGLPDEDTIRTICIDSAFIPPSGDFVFVDLLGEAIYPDVAGAKCWPVAPLCGDANGDGQVNVGDVVYIINFVFNAGPPPDPLDDGDENCDGQVNVGDAVYLINYIFRDGDGPCCL